MEQYFWLISTGMVVGAFGTLIGIGGGIVLIPMLLLLYPKDSPEVITSISLAVVFFNALSGSVAYARMKRIDYKSGLLLSSATVPGAILGVLTVAYIPRQLFNALFGILMMAASTFLILQPLKRQKARDKGSDNLLKREVADANGTVHAFSYNPYLGMGISLAVGYVSSLLGIGGGIIHVPSLIRLLNFPVHIATATSHFILVIMAFTGTVGHVLKGTFAQGVGRTIPLAIGVLIGAQFGAWLSDWVKGVWIIRCLALALGFVGIRIFVLVFLR